MIDNYKDKLKILRQQIPIGLRHGLTLLEKVGGDLEKAKKLFEQEILTLTIAKTGVESDVAFRHLVKNNFDIDLAIISIEEERCTLSELVFKQYKANKETAVHKIYLAVEEKHKLERNFCLDLDELKTLPPEVYHFMVVVEWLYYVDWEGYQYGFTYNLHIVVELIDKQFGLSDLANSLKTAESVEELVFSKYDTQDINNSIKAADEVRKNQNFQMAENEFETQRSILIDRLCEYVQTNTSKFP